MFKQIFEWRRWEDAEGTPLDVLRVRFRIEPEHMKEKIFRDALVAAFKDSLEDFAQEMGYHEENRRPDS